jgi:hypothetical protein
MSQRDEEVDGRSESKLARCIRLLELFHRHGEFATRELVDMFDVDRQTVMRDIRSIREAGVPLEYVGNGRARRHRLADGYRALRVDGLDPITRHVGEVASLTGRVPWQPDGTTAHGLSSRLVRIGAPDARATNPHVDALLGAIANDREVRVRWRVGSASEATRMEPWGLVSIGHLLFLVGRGRTERPMRILVDRLLGVEALGDTFEAPAEGSIERALLASFDFHGLLDVPVRIRLRFGNVAAPFARARPWPARIDWVAAGDESGAWFAAGNLRPLDALAVGMEFGPAVDVFEPAWVRDAVAAEWSVGDDE